MKLSEEMKSGIMGCPMGIRSNTMKKTILNLIPKVEALEKEKDEILNALIESFKKNLNYIDCEACCHGYTYNDDMYIACSLKINKNPSTCSKFEYYEENSYYDKIKNIIGRGKKWSEINENT